MNKYIYFALLMIFMSCNTYKEANTALLGGNYDTAFYTALAQYIKKPTEKNKIKYLPLIKSAYVKGVEKDEQRIDYLRKEANSANLEEVYKLLIDLNDRQNKVKAILPVSLNGKNVDFPVKDYSKAIALVKDKYVAYLYQEANQFLAKPSKLDARTAYERFKQIEELHPNYQNVRFLINQSYNSGLEHVLVELNNQTEMIIPKRLESELLDFNTYGLDKFWTQFYTTSSNKAIFDYRVKLSLLNISISPEQEKLKIYEYEKDIVDGWKYLTQHGEIVKDSLGKPIKVDNYITVKSSFEEISRYKEVSIQAKIQLIQEYNNKVLEENPVQSNFVFSEVYGRQNGDLRALSNNNLEMLKRRPSLFPSNEQMLYDCGMNLKSKFKNIIKKMKL